MSAKIGSAIIDMLEQARTSDPVREFDLDRIRGNAKAAMDYMDSHIIEHLLKAITSGDRKDLNKGIELIAASTLLEAFIMHYPDIQAMIDGIKAKEAKRSKIEDLFK